MKNMKVEIWSDVVCPWCYIGKRRFESALARFDHADQVEVHWKSFQLAPDAPRTSETHMNEVLAKKYGVSKQQAIAMNTQMTELAAKDGLAYHMEKTRYENTFDAHRLIHLAEKHGLQDATKERLMKAYFTDGTSIGDHDSLVKLVSEVGIDADEARAVLDSDAYTNEVKADIRQAREYGINGVPFFAIDEKYGVSGAQSSEALLEVLEQAWRESHPLVMVNVATQNTATCNDDTCTI